MNNFEQIKLLKERGGLTNKQIAAKLGVTVWTVRNYIKLINRRERENERV